MPDTESQLVSSVTSTIGWHESSRVRSRGTSTEESEHSMEVLESKVMSISAGYSKYRQSTCIILVIA